MLPLLIRSWSGVFLEPCDVPQKTKRVQQGDGKVGVALRVSRHFHMSFRRKPIPGSSFPPNPLSAPFFVKLIYCCLWASLKCLISVWILAMKLSSVFASAGAAEDLFKLGPSHCCNHAAGRSGWASSLAYIWTPKHCVTHHKTSASLWRGCGVVLSDESKMPRQ